MATPVFKSWHDIYYGVENNTACGYTAKFMLSGKTGMEKKSAVSYLSGWPQTGLQFF
jgi:hypothetical protein